MSIICKICNFSKNKVLLDTLNNPIKLFLSLGGGGLNEEGMGRVQLVRGPAAAYTDPLITNLYKVCLFILQRHRSSYKNRSSISEETAAHKYIAHSERKILPNATSFEPLLLGAFTSFTCTLHRLQPCSCPSNRTIQNFTDAQDYLIINIY